MPAQQTSSRKRPAWPALLLALLGLGLLAATAWYGSRPTGELFPPLSIALHDAQPAGGVAFVVHLALDPDVPSDADGGRSALQLFEDGVPLVPHGVHQQLRDGALGRFSHWRDAIYLTTSDGSDPRSNGRRYLATLPREVPDWAPDLLLIGLLLGAGTTLLGLLVACWRSRRLGSGMGLLALAAGGVLLITHTSWWSAFSAIDTASRTTLPANPTRPHATQPDPARPGEAPAAARVTSARPGNVTHLLPGGPMSFLATGELSSEDDARHVSLEPEAGVDVQDGFARLQPGGPGLVARFDPPVDLKQIATILVPAEIREGGELQLRLINAADPAQSRVQVALTGAAREGIQPLRIQRPLDFFVVLDEVGMGRLELSVPFTAGHASWLRASEVVLSGPSARFQKATRGRAALSQGDDLRPSVWQSVPGSFRVPLDGPGGLLKGSLALFGQTPAQPVHFAVKHRDGQGHEQQVLDGTLTGPGAWRELRCQLPRNPGTVGEALLLGLDNLPAGTAVGWANWRLVDTSRAPRRVLLVLADTLRADALSVYGGQAGQTPVLDGLARDGVRFEHCYAQAHWTRPSMPSLMTGRYVAATGVDTVGQQLPSGYVTLAEAFAQAGFLTLGDVSNTNAGPSAGLGQGWDQLRLYRDPGLGPARDQLSGDLPARLALVTEEDLLLYVHLMDAHGPYGPRADPGMQGSTGDAPLERLKDIDRPWLARPTAEGRRYWYERDVEVLDAGLGGFLATLQTLWGNKGRQALCYAIASDHGEYLGEHGQWGHDWYELYPEILHVPLILGGPSLPAGRVVQAPVENIDLAPTLLALCGIGSRALPDIDGHSLLSLLRDGDTSRHRVAVASVRLGRQQQLSLFSASTGLIGDQHQLIARLDLSPGSEQRALLDGDDSGRNDVARGAQAPSLFGYSLHAALATRFGVFWRAHFEAGESRRVPLWRGAANPSGSVDPAALRQLQELGYLDR